MSSRSNHVQGSHSVLSQAFSSKDDMSGLKYVKDKMKE